MQEQGLLSHTGTKAELSSRMPARPFVALPNSSARRDCQQSWPCSGLERCCAVPPSCRRCSASCLASKQSAGPCCAMQGFLPARSASSLSSLCEAQPRAAPAGEAPRRYFTPFSNCFAVKCCAFGSEEQSCKVLHFPAVEDGLPCSQCCCSPSAYAAFSFLSCYFFPLIELFAALALNTIVAIKNNIKKNPQRQPFTNQHMKDLAGGGLGSAGE